MPRLARCLAAPLLAVALLAGPMGAPGHAAEPSATELFFETPYLATLPAGTHLAYAYRHTTAEAKLGDGFEETMDLSVAPGSDGKPEAMIALHRGEHASEAGPFPVDAGNPLALLVLEREVNEIAQLTKGSPFYIRNRLREGLVKATVEPARIEQGGQTVDGWKLSMTPFATDPNKDKLAEIAGRRYEWLFSREVPGGLYAVRIATPRADGTNLIDTQLSLTPAAPAAK